MTLIFLTLNNIQGKINIHASADLLREISQVWDQLNSISVLIILIIFLC